MDFITQGDFHNRAALKAGYLRHYERVRALVPKERLLEFKAKDGWEPLCAFLGKDVLTEAYKYPFVNEARSVVAFHERMWWAAFWRAAGKVGVRFGVVGGVLGGAWWVAVENEHGLDIMDAGFDGIERTDKEGGLARAEKSSPPPNPCIRDSTKSS